MPSWSSIPSCRLPRQTSTTAAGPPAATGYSQVLSKDRSLLDRRRFDGEPRLITLPIHTILQITLVQDSPTKQPPQRRGSQMGNMHWCSCRLGGRSGCRFSSKTSCIFTLNSQSAKVPKYYQSIKIRFSTQNIKISAVSTPIFARISPFFCIFRDLPEYIGENASKCQKNAKILRTKFRKFSENQQKTVIF